MRKNSVRKRYTESQLIEAVKNAISIAGVLKLVGLKPAGANYSNIKRHIKELQLDTSHWKGQGWNKGQNLGHRRDISEYLIDNTLRIGPVIGSNALRKRLIKEGFKRAECENCKLREWNGQPAPLELDHINGNHEDNRIENLQILCPNCHAQTETYRGKNKITKEIKLRNQVKEKTVKLPYDHNALTHEEINSRLEKISHINLTKFGWVQKVSNTLNISHTQARRFIDKYYSDEVYTRKPPE
jgi:Zn finger protein HypA/HybF involved in hydrogenase expression